MTEEAIKRKEAARKAVHSLRMKKIQKAGLEEVRQLAGEIHQAQTDFDNDYSSEGFICKHITPTTWESFCRWGDQKCSTAGMILYYIQKKGMPLDVQALHMSNDFGKDIHPEELAQFMIAYDKGVHLYPALQRIQELKMTFRQIAGFHYEDKWCKKNIFISYSSSLCGGGDGEDYF